MSLVLHLGLLVIPMLRAPAAAPRVPPPQTLEVILLNARPKKPKDYDKKHPATALAQASWAGAGNAEKGRSQTLQPEQQHPAADPSRQLTPAEQLGLLKQRQQELLSRLKKTQASNLSGQNALAEIERRIQEENARPRKRYLGPSTREVVYAQYYDRLRRQIETQGSLHFPIHQGQRLYGALTVILTVDSGGRIVDIEMVESSGRPELDRRARAIAMRAAPFGNFDAAMLSQADLLAWVIRFTFNAADGLQTQLHEPTATAR